MNSISQSNFLQALGWALLNSLWQMALLWITYQCITFLLRKISSSRKSLLATTFLFTGFAWFVFTLCSIYFSETFDNTIATGFAEVKGNEELNQWFTISIPVASILYLLLLFFPLAGYIRNYRYVQVIRRYGLSKTDVQLRIFVRNVSAQMGISKKVNIWLSALVSSPVTIGYLKPIILLPVTAVNQLSTEQAEAILLHELAHIRRHDYFINLLIKLVHSILYFNPFVKAFVRIIEREREKSCDEMVMQYQYDPHGYASALLVLEQSNHRPKNLVLAAAGKRNDLLHRIEWIMGVNKSNNFSFNKVAGVLAGVLCVIVLNAVLILNRPQNKNIADDQSIQSSLATIASPLYFFSDADENNADKNEPNINISHNIASKENTTDIGSIDEIKNGLAMDSKNMSVEDEIKTPGIPVTDERFNYITTNPLASTVTNFEKMPVPVLKKYQEAQVKKAIADTRKVLVEGQWKEVEKNLAEVFTQQQKDELRAEYMKEISKLNLKKWEEKLKVAYDKVNWERVNLQLANAVNEIRIDSLQHVYAKAMNNLSKVQKELEINQLTSIPDTDITIELVEEKKQEVQKAIDKLKGVKTRKIVRL